ncbi:CoA pyrophosphatase [Mucilaginibacter gynuensis]|uniref:CoA pyrophosphatase n=2 Tax=Mucilaginibacter gynuensis TaxID=1302236 RepID=A0ABP8HH81_9SPHI
MEATSAVYLGVTPNEQTRKSAVLMLLYPFEDEIYLPLILRSSYDGVHSGQVAFPGGRYELTDQDLTHTALREACEEIGVKISDIKILGTLTEIYIAPSDFLVLPVVGYLNYRPVVVPDPREVKAVLEIRLDHFSEPGSIKCSEILIPGDRVTTPYYEVEGHKVWGATAKMIRELLSVLDADAPINKS